MPKVSVIILTYNRAELLRLAITSVLEQTFQDFEIVVIDDASKDNTEEVVNSFRDGRIKYIRHKLNKGEGRGRNSGVKNSTGEYIAFLDDDDEWFPEKLGAQIHILQNSPPEVGAVYTGCLCIDKSTGKVDSHKVPSKRGDISKEIFKENFIIVSSILLKKSCIENVGLFDELVPFGLDYDMWIRLAKSYQFEYIKKPMVKYYVHQNRLNTNFAVVTKGIEKMLEKYSKDFSLFADYHSRRYYALGLLYCLMGCTQKCREACFNSIKLYPLQIKGYVLFSISFFGANAVRRILQMYLSIKNSLIGQKKFGELREQ